LPPGVGQDDLPRRRQDEFDLLADGPLGRRVEGPDRFQFVPEELEPEGILRRGREKIEHMPSDAEFAPLLHQRLPPVAARQEHFGQGVSILRVPDGNGPAIALQHGPGHDLLYQRLQGQRDDQRKGRQQAAKPLQPGQLRLTLEGEEVRRDHVPRRIVQDPLFPEEKGQVPGHVAGLALRRADHDQETLCVAEQERQVEGLCRPLQAVHTQGCRGG